MRILCKLSVSFFLVWVLASGAQAQSDTSRTGEVHYLKLGNGMNATVMPITSAPNTEITFCIKAGTMYESDSVSGIANILQHILAGKIFQALKNNQDSVSLQNTSFYAYTTSEHTIFKFNTQPGYVAACLNLVKECIFSASIADSVLNQTKDSILQEIEKSKQYPAKAFEDKILKSLYRQDYEKMNPTGNPDKFKNISKQYVSQFYEKYYAPNNTNVIATGNLNHTTFDLQFEKIFEPLIKSVYDPEQITNIVDFRPMIYTTQFIVEDSTFVPEFNICWQFPGTFSNQKASYSAHLFCTMLNDNDNFIQVKAAKMGCKKLLAQYESNNFTGVLRIIVQPDTANFFVTYQFIVDELIRLDKTLVNESMMNAGKLQFRKNYAYLKMTKEFPEKIVHHTAFKDNSYFLLLLDSVLTVREKTLKSFVVNYMSESPYVTGLKISKSLRANLKLDSVFNTINESVANYVFRYRQNITDLEGADNLTMQSNLLQWLRINSDIFVQVNGYSDEGEYGKSRDKSMMQFVDSLPTFRKQVPDLIQKGFFRPEMMRAMKIIKYLYENGITSNRLSGTGMKFSSATNEEEIENMKCTLTFDKLRQNKNTREH